MRAFDFCNTVGEVTYFANVVEVTGGWKMKPSKLRKLRITRLTQRFFESRDAAVKAAKKAVRL